MLGYYINLALRSMRRNRVLTALMILAIGLGIGAAMTTLTVYHVLSGDPIPQKSARLFYVQLDAEDENGYQPGREPEVQLTRFDAEALLRDAGGERQAMMTGGSVVVAPDKAGLSPFIIEARYTSADFFAMFDVPFAQGGAWSKNEDEARARVAVIAKTLARKLFDSEDAIGKTLHLREGDFRIVGVVGDWQPTLKYYDVFSSATTDAEQVYLPFSTSRDLKMGPHGTMNCWGGNDAAAAANDSEGSTGLNAHCAWIQYWVELASPDKAADYKQYLLNYSEQQRSAGRFKRPANVRLRNVMQWMDFNKLVPDDVRLQVWLALGFLAVCLVNMVGLLLAKFLRRNSELCVRRALGASRNAIFGQCLTEAGTIGMAGGLLGLALALLGLWVVRQQPDEYARLVQMDSTMLLATFALALCASLLAGIVPAWRACQVMPAMQLKSQ